MGPNGNASPAFDEASGLPFPHDPAADYKSTICGLRQLASKNWRRLENSIQFGSRPVYRSQHDVSTSNKQTADVAPHTMLPHPGQSCKRLARRLPSRDWEFCTAATDVRRSASQGRVPHLNVNKHNDFVDFPNCDWPARSAGRGSGRFGCQGGRSAWVISLADEELSPRVVDKQERAESLFPDLMVTPLSGEYIQ